MATTSPPQAPNTNGPSRSPPRNDNANRQSLTGQLTALGARISRAISRDGTTTEHDSASAISASSTVGASEADKASRSRSRGRELYSTGRGGAGNIHHAEDASSPHPGLEDLEAPIRGRDPISHGEKLTHVGRGGAGNIRSPSREPIDLAKEAAIAEQEREIIREADAHARAVSTGRGGVGNIATDRSRSRGAEARSASRGRAPALHSSGRGGAGNITGDVARLEEEDLERLEHRPRESIHSTGRGGIANITEKQAPGVEGIPHTSGVNEGEFVSQGRGGAGNIHPRSRSKEAKGSGVLGGLTDKVHNLHLGSGHKDSRESEAKR